MSVRVKICGVNTPAAFDAAAEAAADWIGFVFYPASPRFVTPSGAAILSGRLACGPGRVGLFVDPSDDEIAEVLDRMKLAALQLYAPAARISTIRAKFDVPVWRSLAVQGPEDLPESAGVAACLVVEPQPPDGASRPGGNGQALDWSWLAGWEPECAWMLAGGLTPDNVARAVAMSGAAAVDVSSGVESEPGIKDPALIAAFVAAAKGA
jgi:phosphoribosylanthranilate isomerase